MNLLKILILGIAVMTAMIGCGSDDDDLPVLVGGLTLSVDHDSIAASEYETVTFTVTNAGNDITSQCKIWNMTSAKVLPGRTFSTTESGTYKFAAKYGNTTSNEVIIKAEAVKYFLKNVLLEQMTSTACNNCPAFTNNLLIMEKEVTGNRMKWVAFHGPLSYDDPFQINAYINELARWGEFFPNGIIDQTEAWGQENKTEQQAKRFFTTYLDLPGKAGIAIDSKVEGNKITVNATVKSLMNFPSGCKILVILTENYLTAPQSSGSQTIRDYVHDHVVRKCLTSVTGNLLPDDILMYGKDYEETFTYELTEKDQWILNNMDVTVAIIDAEKDHVVNCQAVKLGEKVGFEYAE